MPERNRVTPFGEIVAIEQRGTLLGNRGSIHRERAIVRPWQVRRWITCALTYKDQRAPMWEPGRWTPLFFWDEAVALAAGHRPCALCRRPDFDRWMDGWEAATGERPTVDPVDRILHEERATSDRRQRVHRRSWRSLPTGTFVVVRDGPAVLDGDGLRVWRPDATGYGPVQRRPTSGRAEVLTPRSTVDVLAHGYVPALHPAIAAAG